MPLNRRNMLLAGTGASLAVLLYGCGDTNSSSQAQAATDTGAAPDGDVALYDGSPAEPFDSVPVHNPAGLADRPEGGVNATVTLVEYVSPTCPFCANFHATVYPRLKEEYIDTGRIRFIARPFRRNVLDLAVFMVAEASGERYHEVLSAYMASQNFWASNENPRQAIFEVAQQFGFTQETFEAALTDEQLLAALEETREQALNQFGLQGTPTFFINGDRFTGNASYEDLSAEINRRL